MNGIWDYLVGRKLRKLRKLKSIFYDGIVPVDLRCWVRSMKSSHPLNFSHGISARDAQAIICSFLLFNLRNLRPICSLQIPVSTA
jgi:hypothetical protein